MPITKTATVEKKRKSYNRVRGKSATSANNDDAKDTHKTFLTIGPALPNVQNITCSRKLNTRSHSTLNSAVNPYDFLEDGKLVPGNPVFLQTTTDGKVHASRNQKEKERYPDRISLDRRGLSTLPIIDGEPRLRLLSIQHNLLTKLDGLQSQNFLHLVFLDIYDNQLDRISPMDSLVSLRVLLMGKNRIRRMEGLKTLTKLEVLDLHGNQISNVTGLSALSEIKVLNLAGNHIKVVGTNDLRGLKALREINLRRNKIRKLLGFAETPQLEKLFISNNDLQNVEDMSSVAKATNLKEITIDNNPVSLGGDCVSFLVSYLPSLNLLSNMQVTDQVRKAAMAWRHSKETSNATFTDLSNDVTSAVRREEVISNARTNWELLRSQTKCLTATASSTYLRDLKNDCDFVLTPTDINASTSLVNTSLEKGKRKKLALCKRSHSQETEHTSSSNSCDFFRLPPILVPIINNLEQKIDSRTASVSSRYAETKLWDIASSVDPNVDSSVSSLPSSSSSSSDEESDSEKEEKPPVEKPRLEIIPKAPTNEPELKITATTLNNIDNASTISTGNSSTTSNNSAMTGSSCGESVASNTGSLNSRMSRRSVKSAMPCRRNASQGSISRAVTAKATGKQKPPVSTSPAPSPPSKDREQGGDYLVEICGRSLNVFGQGALRFIDRAWSSQKAYDVTTVKFTYINYNGIASILTKLKNRFQNAENFIFNETNINCLAQLNALAEVQGLSSLEINSEGNPITEKDWRSYAIFRLSHWGLKRINDVEVTEAETQAANEEFQSLSDLVLWSLPDVLLQPLLARLQLENSQSASQLTAKQWLLSADPALRSVVAKEALQWRRGAVSPEDLAWRQKGRIKLGTLFDNTCDAILKLNLLEKEWPAILKDLVQNTLLDYSQLDTYMKTLLRELKY